MDFEIAPYGVGGEAIAAAAPATAKPCPFDPEGAGNYIVLDHGNGHRTRYLHLNSPPLPSNGSPVARGEIIGYEGSTGYTDPPGFNHLHFETRHDATTFTCGFDGTAFDPYGSPYAWTTNPPSYAQNFADVATFYDYGSGDARIHTWLSDGEDTLAYQTPAGWWPPGPVSYTLSLVGDRFVTGDFDGNGYGDVAVLYGYSSGHAFIDLWFSDGSDFHDKQRWWEVQSDYYVSDVAGRLVAGDFDDNGKDDIAAFYDYGSGAASIHVWRTNTSGTDFMYASYETWWSTPSGYHLGNVADRFVAADFTGDGKDDLTTFYRYPSEKPWIHVWTSMGGGLSNWVKWWPQSPTTYLLSQVGDRMVAGKFNGDKYADIATFFDVGDGTARINVWTNSGSSSFINQTGGWWYSVSGYSLSQVDDRMVSADLDGDALKDIATFYQYPASAARIHVWLADPMQTDPTKRFDYKGPGGWWSSYPYSYTLGNVAGRMVAGDFDGR